MKSNLGKTQNNMENKIVELMLRDSKIVDLGDEGEMPVLNVEQFRDIAREIVKLFAIPDVIVAKRKVCHCLNPNFNPMTDRCHKCGGYYYQSV